MWRRRRKYVASRASANVYGHTEDRLKREASNRLAAVLFAETGT